MVVVLDACDDGSDGLAGEFGPDVHFVTRSTRATSARRAPRDSITRVRCAPASKTKTSGTPPPMPTVRWSADWLVRMTAADADVVLGVVRIPAWRNFSAEVARRYLRAYKSKGPQPQSHSRRQHGLSGRRLLARSADSAPWPQAKTSTSCERFEAAGMRIHRDAKLSVATSDRREGRAPGGFANHLRELSGSVRKRRGRRAAMSSGLLIGRWLASGAVGPAAAG